MTLLQIIVKRVSTEILLKSLSNTKANEGRIKALSLELYHLDTLQDDLIY